MSKPLVLVVIDGLDSAGKNTQAFKLCTYLCKNGKTVCMRFHPSDDNFFGVKAKQYLYSRGKSAHFLVALFYMLDVIRSILLYSWQRYDFMIFIRYLMGTAYLPWPLHKVAYHFFALIVPTSDYMFFLDVSAEEAHSRIIQNRRMREAFESLDALKRTRQKALALAWTGKWTIIDANKSTSDVQEEIRTRCNVQPGRPHSDAQIQSTMRR